MREGLEKKMEAGQEKMWERMEAQAKDTKAGQEKMREGLEKKMEAGQERIDALFRDLITGQENQLKELKTGLEDQLKELKTGQENQLKDSKAGQEKMEERLEKKMEAQAKDSKAGKEKMEVLEKLGIGAVAFLSAQQGGLFSSLWASIKPLLP